MKYKILTPKVQLQAEINEHLNIKGDPVNAFYQEIHMRSKTYCRVQNFNVIMCLE